MQRNCSNFPLSVFPQELEEVIRETSIVSGCPAEYMASAMLVAISCAMGNDWELEVKSSWRERALLYMAIVGNAGTNKTFPITFALEPLVKRDFEAIEAAALCEPYIAPPRYVASDVTQEGLVRLHEKNPHGLVLFVDELKAWIANFSRYSGGSQEQFWLSNFSRTPIIVDRKSDPKPVSIAAPLISVIGSVQPRVLRQFATGDKGSNGFVDRMLFTIKRDAEKPYWSDFTPSANHKESWAYIIEYLLDYKAPASIKFSAAAQVLAGEWQAANADIVNGCKNDRIVGAYSKMEIHFVRFCLILHALRCCVEEEFNHEEIAPQTVSNAALLADYFRSQREAAEDLLYPDEESELAERPMMLYRALPPIFTRAEAVRIAKTIGITKTPAYAYIKQLTGSFIEQNESGEFYKLDADL